MNNKLKKLLSLSVASLALVACGNGEESDPNEITFWNPFVGPDRENMNTMIEEYNATDPEFTIKNISMEEGDMYTRIPTVVNSGSGIPDLNIIHAERIVQYKDADMLITLDEYMDDFPELNENNYIPEAWNIGEIDEERYSLPLDIHTYGMYYNPELVEKYGPEILDDDIVTFDEIREVSEKAVADGITGLGITWVKPIYMALLAQYGGQLSENGIDPTLDTQESIDALQLYVDLYNDGLTNEEGTDPMQMLLNGELVFYPEGIWMQNTMRDADFEYGLTNFPQLSDNLEDTVNWSSSHQFVMFNNDDRSEEKTRGAIEFIDWLRDNSMEWAEAGQIPATLSLLDDEEYLEFPHAFFAATPEQADTLQIFDYKYNGYVSDYLNDNVLDVIFGRLSAEDAANEMQSEVLDKIEQDSTGLQDELDSEVEEE